MRPLTLGICAHVDAGKTTLSEAMLYKAGTIRKLGRVDHKDAFLDTYELEKTRGITIFSKQAIFDLEDRKVTLIDTPGHVDFSAEMERALGILDLAILVISAPDKINAKVKTLWSLLNLYNIPTIIFVNKMDQVEDIPDFFESFLSEKLKAQIVNFDKDINSLHESIAMSDEKVMEKYLEGGALQKDDIEKLIKTRTLFPMICGSALKLRGVDKLMEIICEYAPTKHYRKEFGARVFKINRDDDGNRLSFLKIEGGEIKVRDSVENGENHEAQKISQIRFYSGDKYEAKEKAVAGDVCAVLGLSHTHVGDGLGFCLESSENVIEPVLNCAVVMSDDMDPYKVWQNLMILGEEEPMLRVSKDEETGEISVSVMGEIQMEILKQQMLDRFGMSIDFGAKKIIYKETIGDVVEGVGHFEPLRHYAEVHLLMEPLPKGSGLIFDTKCSSDILATNWQRLILSHLEEKKHKGVLTGSDITDMKITLIGGKAHVKHTEGGDFRNATYRAVRQGLMMAKSILLEPFYKYEINIKRDLLGRAMSDMQMFDAVINAPIFEGDTAIITGSVSVRKLSDYASTIRNYSKGEGSITCTFDGYEPCKDAADIIAAGNYDPTLDVANPTSSVFCAHGSGVIVEWDKVRDMMHFDSGFRFEDENRSSLSEYEDEYAVDSSIRNPKDTRSFKEKERDFNASRDELIAIFERTYGKIKTRNFNENSKTRYESQNSKSSAVKDANKYKKIKKSEKYLLIDGYNILFASARLKELADINMDSARESLIDIVSNFAGYIDENVIIVFDAYRVKGGMEKQYKYAGIDIIYTKEAETADQYIEKVSIELSKNYKVRVATSDFVEKVIIMGTGAESIRADSFWNEVERVNGLIRDEHIEKRKENLHNYVLSDETLSRK